MLSVAPLASAGEAGKYYANDNYYAQGGDARDSAQWWGSGAQALGLSGPLERAAFEAILGGKLPGGAQLRGAAEGAHRAGLDLTFSAPKSVSLLALVGGDARLLQAHREAVNETLSFAEQHLAEARTRSGAGMRVIEPTGNLAVALFHHDTSRALDPQLHTHAVIANLTRRADGKWVALHNDALWTFNTLLGQMYHGRLEAKAQALGYETERAGKHGAFEIAGLPRAAVLGFSQRRVDILEALEETGATGGKAGDTIALKTRPRKSKEQAADRLPEWRARAADSGLDLKGLITQSHERGAEQGHAQQPGLFNRLSENLAQAAFNARSFAQALYDSLGGRRVRGSETFRPHGLATLDTAQIRAGETVAAAIRHLAEREAVFTTADIVKTGLSFAPKADPRLMFEAIKRLSDQRRLVPTARARGSHRFQDAGFTTPAALDLERCLLAQAQRGQGVSRPILDAHRASQNLSDRGLNGGQVRAGTLILSSHDRIVAVEGVAGSGKSVMIAHVAQLAHAQGRRVIGLAHQNRVANALRHEAGLQECMTVERFLARVTEKPGASAAQRASVNATRHALKGAVIIVDETGMLSMEQDVRLLSVLNDLEVERVAQVGGKRQLGAIDWGRPHGLLEERGLASARMDQNLRQKDPTLRQAADLAHDGRIAESMAVLAGSIRDVGNQGLAQAVAHYLALPEAERARTLLLAQSRAERTALNTQVQAGLLADGRLRPDHLNLRVDERVSLTREERRRASSYHVGDHVRFGWRCDRAGIRNQADGTITAVREGIVTFIDAQGRTHRFDPTRITDRPGEDKLQLITQRDIKLHEGDQVRWTANDPERGLASSDRARVVGVHGHDLFIETASGQVLKLGPSDPMRRQIDLAYALTVHAAQGDTARHVVALLSANSPLTTQANYYVTISRERESLLLLVDDRERLARMLELKAGAKTSALDAIDPRRTLGLTEPQATPSALDVTREPSPTRSTDAQPPLNEPTPQPLRDRQIARDFGR